METARRFHELTVEGRWDEALLLVDLDAKSRRMLGPVYEQAPEADKAVTRDYWAKRLKAVTAHYLAQHFTTGPGKFSLRRQDQGTAEVVQAEDNFALVYTLELRDGTWVIVDRTNEINGVRPSSSAALSFILKRMENDLGHPPDLKKINERLEEYTSRMRIRSFRPVQARPEVKR